MSTSSKYQNIAAISKTHGRKGEVVAVARDGLPCFLKEGIEVVLVPPALKGPRRFEITSCEGQGTSRRISLSGVEDLGSARDLVGRTVLVRCEDLPKDYALQDAHALIGRELYDGRLGLVGAIEEVMRGPANDVWVVRGPYGEVLVPVVEQVVMGMSTEGPIKTDLPRGLVDEGDDDDSV